MITIANHPTAVTNCRVAETIEKRHNLISHGEMLENVRPHSIMEKIPVEGHQQCRAVVDFLAPEFRPRSVMGKYLLEDTHNTAPLLTSWLQGFGRALS